MAATGGESPLLTVSEIAAHIYLRAADIQLVIERGWGDLQCTRRQGWPAVNLHTGVCVSDHLELKEVESILCAAVEYACMGTTDGRGH